MSNMRRRQFLRDAGPCRFDDAVKRSAPPVELNADFPPAAREKSLPRMRCLFDFTLVDGTQ